jgi:NAD(P)-dependent dehydrogenase (short-subunit alcohol dehydrogenase family)
MDKAIVTGHSRGLGQAVAARLLERGIPVLGLARGPAPGLSARFGERLREVALDLGDNAALLAWLGQGGLDAFVRDAGRILLVNNAGTVDPVGDPGQQGPEQVAQAVALNVAAPLVLTAALVQAARTAECRILHVSSGAARQAYPGWSVYCATKAALDMHARAVVEDGLPNVRISSLAPGVIDTAMQAHIRALPEQRFSMRERFVRLHEDGALVAPEACAGQLVDELLHARFGQHPVDDLRSH